MARPSRSRRFFKWTGVGLFVLILATGVFSLWCTVTYVLHADFGVWIDAGRAGFMIPDRTFGGIELDVAHSDPLSPHSFEHRGFERSISSYDAYGWGSGQIYRYSVPFWLLLLLIAIPTAWLWHRDRRLISSAADHRLCLRCGYDLTGNTSGVCPECGDKTCPPAVLANSECSAPVASTHEKSER